MKTSVFLPSGIQRIVVSGCVALTCLLATTPGLPSEVPGGPLETRVVSVLREVVSKSEALSANSERTGADFNREFHQFLEEKARAFAGDEVEVIELLGSHLRASGGAREFPACKVAAFLGVLGRSCPELSVAHLSKSLPMQEESDDQCVMHGMVQLGPSAYEALYEKGRTSRRRDIAWYVTIALFAQTVETEFPERAGLGKGANWPNGLPHERKELQRLLDVWHDWWNGSKSDLEWDSVKLLLQKRSR